MNVPLQNNNPYRNLMQPDYRSTEQKRSDAIASLEKEAFAAERMIEYYKGEAAKARSQLRAIKEANETGEVFKGRLIEDRREEPSG